MKEQTIVTETKQSDFYRAIQTLLKSNWRVIPGTVVVSLSNAAGPQGSDAVRYSKEYQMESYVAFFERDN